MTGQCHYCGEPVQAGWAGCPSCGHPVPPPGGWCERCRNMERSRPRKPPAANVSSKELAFLVVKAGPGAGNVFPLRDSVNIGRDPRGNDIVIDDPHVSRHHARVRLHSGRFSFHDLASLSGSWLADRNGSKHRIKQPVQLVHGDVLYLGPVQLVFMEAGK